MPEAEPRVMYRKQGWTDLLHLLRQGSIRRIQTVPDRHPHTRPRLVDNLLHCFSILTDTRGIPYGTLRPSLLALFTVSMKSTAQPSDSLLDAYISLPPYRMSPLICSQLSWQRWRYLHLQSLSLLCPRLAHYFIFTDLKCWDFLNHPRGIIWTKDPWWPPPHTLLNLCFCCSSNREILFFNSPSFLYIKTRCLPSPPRCLSKGWQSSPLTKHWEEPTGKPDNQGETHAARVFQYSFWGDKDATANHAADEEGESPQQSYLFPQKDGLLFLLVFPHGSLLIPGEGHAFRSYGLPSVLKVHL